MIPEQTRQRKRQTHRRRNAYHAPANIAGLQQNIAAVTLDHILEGKAVDWRNLAITYPLAFDVCYQTLSDMQRIEQGLICPEADLRQRCRKREAERVDTLRRCV